MRIRSATENTEDTEAFRVARTILSVTWSTTVRRMVRKLLWFVKGVLLTVALAALTAWPFSLRSPGMLAFQHFTARDNGIERSGFRLGCYEGRIAFSQDQYWYTGYWERKTGVRKQVNDRGTTWHMLVEPGTPSFAAPSIGDRALGPFRSGASYVEPPGGSWYLEHSYSLPCWLVASLTGIWPLSSLSLHLRRRAQARHSACTGRCHRCRYDLRATPDRYPECGAVPTAKPARPGGSGG